MKKSKKPKQPIVLEEPPPPPPAVAVGAHFQPAPPFPLDSGDALPELPLIFVERDGDAFVTRHLERGVATRGATYDEAREKLNNLLAAKRTAPPPVSCRNQ